MILCSVRGFMATLIFSWLISSVAHSEVKSDAKKQNAVLRFADKKLSVEKLGEDKFFFGKMELFKIKDDTKNFLHDGFDFILEIKGAKYLLRKKPTFEIQDEKGKKIDTSKIESFLEYPSDEVRFYLFMKAIDPTFNIYSRGVEIKGYSGILQSCSDCYASSYCKMNDCNRRWSCDWSKGCVASGE